MLLPNTWSKVADPLSYTFRDDFMGASLNTGATWTRVQTNTGDVEIDTQYPVVPGEGEQLGLGQRWPVPADRHDARQ